MAPAGEPEATANGVLLLVQARTSSARLPGKVLADVAGEPLLALLLRRLIRCVEVKHLVVATRPTSRATDHVESLAQELGTGVYRGARDDVLARFAGAASGHAGPIARITGDCPLIDPEVVDLVIRLFRETDACAYASNVHPPTYPDGLDAEVNPAEALMTADREATSAEDREHVTTFIRRQPDRFPAANQARGARSQRTALDSGRARGPRVRAAGRDEAPATSATPPALSGSFEAVGCPRRALTEFKGRRG